MKIGKDKIEVSLLAKTISIVMTIVAYAIALVVIDLIFDELGTFRSYAIQSVFFGVFGFLLFNFTMNKFAKKIDKEIELDLEEGEELIAYGVANLFRGLEGVGGKLFLTNKQLVFKSHNINVQTGTAKLTLDRIESIEKRKTMFIINNSLLVRTINGHEFKFVVNDRDEWLKVLNESLTLTKI